MQLLNYQKVGIEIYICCEIVICRHNSQSQKGRQPDREVTSPVIGRVNYFFFSFRPQ